MLCSDANCSSQQLSEILSHAPTPDDDQSGNATSRGFSWVMIDLGVFIVPTYFTLRHGTGGFPHWTRTFLFQLSKDGIHFVPCEIALVNDMHPSTATWHIKNNFLESASSFRYVRIHQKCGRHPVCLAGFEVYGQVITAVDIRSSECAPRFPTV